MLSCPFNSLTGPTVRFRRVRKRALPFGLGTQNEARRSILGCLPPRQLAFATSQSSNETVVFPATAVFAHESGVIVSLNSHC